MKIACLLLALLSIQYNILFAQTNNYYVAGKHNKQIITNINNNNNQTTIINQIIKNDSVKLKEILSEISKFNDKLDCVQDAFVIVKEQCDSLNNLKNILIKKLDKNKRIIDSINLANWKLEESLNAIRRNNFLPFGIKQFKYKNTALGCTFLITQIAVPVALGVGLDGAANHNYKLHQERVAITREKHTEYYRKYKGLHKAAIYIPIASVAGIYLINVLCNYYCTKIELTPQTISGPNNMDITGMSLSYNF